MQAMLYAQSGGVVHHGGVCTRRHAQHPAAASHEAAGAAPSQRCCHSRRAFGAPRRPWLAAAHAAAQQQEGSGSTLRPAGAPAAMAEPLALNLPWDEQSKGHVVKSQGLHRAPLSGGVKTATTRFDLPTPPVAVRNLVELARFGNLSTVMSGMHHRRAGYPFGTLVDFAVDGAGHPIFCLSPLALHSRNVLEEPRASLVVQMPGWTGLANARVTIFGDIYQLPADMQGAARDIFFAKHSAERKERWVSGNWVYFRMNRIVDIYFVGGFGTVQWIDPQEYLGSRPDDVVLDHPTRTLQELTALFQEQMKVLIKPTLKNPQAEIEEVVFISIDASGVDVRIRVGSEFNVERISFGERVTSAAAAKDALRRLLQQGSLGA